MRFTFKAAAAILKMLSMHLHINWYNNVDDDGFNARTQEHGS